MRRLIHVLLCTVSASTACSDDSQPAAGESTGATGTGSSSSSAVTMTASATATASASATDAPTTAGPSDPDSTSAEGSTGADTGSQVGTGEVRFVALGDAGEGNPTQIAVGETIATVCAERGCDFALYLGDNFYEVGVDSPMDVQFDEKFEIPYASLDFPFYVTLGNHDYGVLGNEWSKSQHQIEYSTYSDKWMLPAEYYSFQQENAHFIALDTSQIFWGHEVDAQSQFIQQDIAGLQDTWIIAFGHYPYISNGRHGNAGNYEGLGGIIGGAPVQDFFEENICGQAHIYICGHDHNRQWLLPECGTEFLVSGGGAKLTGLVSRDDNPTYFEDDESPGFLWVEIIDNSFTGVFYDVEGVAQYERTITL